MNNIDKTLDERGTRYGEFPQHASITQGIKDAMSKGRNWDTLDDDMKEALEMTAHKIGRILNGDPNYIDSWHDIIGYARLVEQRLKKAQAPASMNDEPKTTLGNIPHEAFAKAAKGTNPALIEVCDCSACDLRRKLRSVFGPDAEIRFITEEGEDH